MRFEKKGDHVGHRAFLSNSHSFENFEDRRIEPYVCLSNGVGLFLCFHNDTYLGIGNICCQ